MRRLEGALAGRENLTEDPCRYSWRYEPLSRQGEVGRYIDGNHRAMEGVLIPENGIYGPNANHTGIAGTNMQPITAA